MIKESLCLTFFIFNLLNDKVQVSQKKNPIFTSKMLDLNIKAITRPVIQNQTL